VIPAAPQYLVSWYRFDNATGQHEPVGEEAVLQEDAAQLPRELSDAPFVAASLRAVSREHPGWRRATRAYFRKNGAAWQTVGIERLGELPGGVGRGR
jgi:hypothetical protein